MQQTYRRILRSNEENKQRLVIIYGGLFIFYAFLLLPIVWLVLSSFRNSDSIQSGRLTSRMLRANGSRITSRPSGSANLITYLVNSFVIAISVMLLVVFIGSLGAYALSRFN